MLEAYTFELDLLDLNTSAGDFPSTLKYKSQDLSGKCAVCCVVRKSKRCYVVPLVGEAVCSELTDGKSDLCS